MSKLDPESLAVTSFEPVEASIARPITDTSLATFDPTGCTYCFICPAFTGNCA